MSSAEGKDLGKCSTGIDPKVGALLAYLVGFISGIIFFVIEKENKFVKFHAMQSIMVSVVFFILGFIPVLNFLTGIVGLVAWILCMVKSYQGEWFKLPIAGDFAAKQVGGI
jgi:uncharacterized membrane protein